MLAGTREGLASLDVNDTAVIAELSGQVKREPLFIFFKPGWPVWFALAGPERWVLWKALEALYPVPLPALIASNALGHD